MKPRVYHDIQCRLHTKSGPCNCQPIVIDDPVRPWWQMTRQGAQALALSVLFSAVFVLCLVLLAIELSTTPMSIARSALYFILAVCAAAATIDAACWGTE